MKTKQRRTPHHGPTGTDRAVSGHGSAPAPGPGPLPAPEIEDPRTVGPGTYEVTLDFVSTRQSADPAQVPWLGEIRGDQHLNDSFSEVI